jgi:hypothetical protein
VFGEKSQFYPSLRAPSPDSFLSPGHGVHVLGYRLRALLLDLLNVLLEVEVGVIRVPNNCENTSSISIYRKRYVPYLLSAQYHPSADLHLLPRLHLLLANVALT